ncbi:MAG: HPr family phosphocarrier protein [Leptospirales bacterium]|nr:HPr family phosphocarrier protein [Leptospirales bacterium]
MLEREVVVTGDAGIHARPAMMLVREAMKYECSVKLIKDDIEADCKSIMSVLGLAIIPGSLLKIVTDGVDEDKVINSIVSMIESNFDFNKEVL